MGLLGGVGSIANADATTVQLSKFFCISGALVLLFSKVEAHILATFEIDWKNYALRICGKGIKLNN